MVATQSCSKPALSPVVTEPIFPSRLTAALVIRAEPCRLLRQAALESPRAVPCEPSPPTELEAAVFAPVATGVMIGVTPQPALGTPAVVVAADAAPAEGVVAAVISPVTAAAAPVIVVSTETATASGGFHSNSDPNATVAPADISSWRSGSVHARHG